MGNKSNSRRKKRPRAKAATSASNVELDSESVKQPNTVAAKLPTDVPSTIQSTKYLVPALINFSIGESPFVVTSAQVPVLSLQVAAVPLQLEETSTTAKVPKKSDSSKSLNSTEMDDDVIYLYTVESKKAKLIEVIDLLDDNKDITEISQNRELMLSTRSLDSKKSSKLMFELPKILFTSQGVFQKDPIISALDNNKGPSCVSAIGRKRKRCEVEVAYCIICHVNYENIRKNGNYLFSSKCGHLFCTVCLKNLKPYKCIECNQTIWNLCKIYL